MTPLLKIEELKASAGEFQLENISFSFEREEYLIVIGPTGCGKTMLLETLAGLRKPAGGHVWLNGKEITYLPPEARAVGFAYQDSLLYPFLNVRENILFGAKAQKKYHDQKIRLRLNKIVEAMGIAQLLDRFPVSLSGGEKQRVSLARAILTCPPVLFLDEPLSALDPQTRLSMQELLHEMHQREEMGVIHVTHDFKEALQLGTKVIVINQGRICQQGKPITVFNQPNSLFVAKFLMQNNIKDGFIVKRAANFWFIDNAQKLMLGPLNTEKVTSVFRDTRKTQQLADVNQFRVHLMIRADEFEVLLKPLVSADVGEKHNTWQVILEKVIFHNTHVELCCYESQNIQKWQVILSLREYQRLKIDEKIGKEVYLSIDLEKIHLIRNSENCLEITNQQNIIKGVKAV